MRHNTHTLVVLALALIIVSGPVSSFVQIAGRYNMHSSTVLFGRSIKRGQLADNISPGSVIKTTKKRKKGGDSKSSSSASSSAASAAGSGGVSNKLSQWAGIDTSEDAMEVELPSVARTKGGTKKRSNRKERNAERRAEEYVRAAAVNNAIDDLDDILNPVDEEGKPKRKRKVEYDMDVVLGNLKTLIDNPNPNSGLRVLTAGQKLRNYRMAWAGSDEAVCHLGTGLHNVPLARLEEVFLTLGKNRIDVKEVIRILGPFPNIRNTLKGGTRIGKEKSLLQIEYDSMIDGTGKEILAGTEKNKKIVDLDVLFADDDAILCVVPPSDADKGKNPLDGGGSMVLLFFNEEQMDLKLEMMRVA